MTVNLAFTGTATPTSDYTRSGTSIVIPAGSTTGSITLTAVQDAIYEYPYETIIVDIATVVNGTESGTQQVTAIITDDDPVPAGGYATRETFDSYTNGTLLSAISGWWTVGSYAVVSGGGVNGSPGIGTDGGQSHILNWQSQPFQWSTLPVSTKVAIGMDFQSSPAGTFDDDRVAWTVDAASDTTSANQCGLQIDTVSDGGNVV